MLKIRAPIKTVSNPDFLDSQEAFCERITANYMQIGQYINEADLLHVVTEPPEIFVMDGGMTSLFSSTNVEKTQIAKTQIINNLINRILISADAGLSYQDNVYISNVLHKLGIKDEKTFLNEVMRLTKESRESHDTVNFYWEHLDELREMVYEYSAESTSEIRKEAAEQLQPVLHLHEEVNKRLQTAAIYRIIQNFYDNSSSPRNITNESFRIAEQGRMSREMLLTRLREEVRQEPAYLTYRHNNIYEGDEVTGDEVTVEDVSTRVTSAVLLTLIDNIYDSVYDRLDHHVHNWLSTESAYYGAAENTLFRIEQNTAYLQYLYEQAVSLGDERSEYREELNILNQLVDMRTSPDYRIQQSYGGNLYDTHLTHLQNAGDLTEVADYTDRSTTELNRITRQGDVIDAYEGGHEPVGGQNADGRLPQSDIRNLQETNIAFSLREGDIFGQSDVRQYSETNLTHVTRDGDMTEVTQNIHAPESKDAPQQLFPQPGTVNRTETNIIVDRRAGDVTEVTDRTDRTNVEITHVTREGDTAQTTEVSEHRDELTQQVIAAYEQNIVRNQKYMRNLKNVIEQHQQPVSTETPAQRMMRESRLSLEHPEEFLREYQENQEKAGREQVQIRSEIESVFSPQQQIAYNLVRQYMMAPERFYNSNIISADNMGLLLHDIHEVEHAAYLAGKEEESSKEAGSGIGAGVDTAQPVMSVYPPSSDTTVHGSYFPVTGQIAPEMAEAFQNMTLSYIYPIYGNVMFSEEEMASVEAVAQKIRQQAAEKKEAAGKSEEAADLVSSAEPVRTAERSIERIFTNIREQIESQPGDKILLHRDGEIVSAITERVVERWTERRERMPEPEITYSDQVMSMVHRNRETVIDEEVIENLQQQIRRIDETSQSTQRKVMNQMTEHTTVVNNMHNETIQENSEAITKMVNKSMRRQIDEISDKVYHKIERQLKNEQRRRGL